MTEERELTPTERKRLRRAYDQAVTHEQDLKVGLKDWQKELDATDPDFEPKRHTLLTAEIAELKEQLAQTQREMDELHLQIRKHGVPEAEPVHPGGAVAALLERDKRPIRWGQGGDIKDRDASWESPEVPGDRRRR